MKRTSRVMGVLGIAGLLAAPAWAQTTPAPQPQSMAPAAAPEPAAPAKPWTLTAGLDFTSAYLFRGILQADRRGDTPSPTWIWA